MKNEVYRTDDRSIDDVKHVYFIAANRRITFSTMRLHGGESDSAVSLAA